MTDYPVTLHDVEDLDHIGGIDDTMPASSSEHRRMTTTAKFVVDAQGRLIGYVILGMLLGTLDDGQRIAFPAGRYVHQHDTSPTGQPLLCHCDWTSVQSLHDEFMIDRLADKLYEHSQTCDHGYRAIARDAATSR